MFWLLVFAVAQTPLEPAHASNPVLRAVLEPSQPLHLPPPILREGMSAEEEKKALVDRVGSASRLEEMLKDSVSAPIDLKLSDIRSGDESLVRVAALIFAVHGSRDLIDADEISRKGEKQVVEAGNMRFESREIDEKTLTDRKIPRALDPDGKPTEWYIRMEGRLLDRIALEETNRVFSTRSPRSLVVASMTVDGIDPEFPNRWSKLEANKAGDPRPYAGGVSLVKVSELAMRPGVLLVEANFAFVEPKAWFGGEPVLRSKIGLAAQDQVRNLRRELAKRKKRPTSNP